MKVAVTPSATPLLTREAIFKMKEAGWCGWEFRWTARRRRFTTHFADCPAHGREPSRPSSGPARRVLPIQVHTTISRHNANDLDNLCALFEKLAIVMWNVFFLVPVGRGQLGDLLSGRRIRASVRQDLRVVAPGELPDQDDRSDALSALSAAAQPAGAEDGAWRMDIRWEWPSEYEAGRAAGRCARRGRRAGRRGA